MLRVFFPAGNPITVAYSHNQFYESYSKALAENDACSITLLSRVFSLLNVDLGSNDKVMIVKDEHLDFDLALFSTYASAFK